MKHINILEYRQIGNDIFCNLGECKCPSRLFIGSSIEHIMKESIKISGYYDDNFFDNVNKDIKKWECSKCDTVCNYRWTRDGVIIYG